MKLILFMYISVKPLHFFISLNFIISQGIIVIYSFWKVILSDFKTFDNLLLFIFLKIKETFFVLKCLRIKIENKNDIKL